MPRAHVSMFGSSGPPQALATGLPAWRVGMAVYEWKQIPGTSMKILADAKGAEWTGGLAFVEGPAAIFNDWNGGSLDTRDSTLYMMAAGGHQGYGGNQTIKLKISVDSPAWAEMAPTSDASQVAQDARTYLDGRPPSAHTYFRTQFIEARNRVFRFGSLAVVGTGGTIFPDVRALNLGTGLYEADGTYTDAPGASFARPVCKDPVTENVFLWNNDFYRWNQSDASWELLNSIGTNDQPGGGALCVDTRRNRAFYCGGFVGGQYALPSTIDLTTPYAFNNVTLTGADAAQVHPDEGPGMTFHPHPSDAAQDYFYFRKGVASGGTVYRINASTFAVDQLTTTGGSSIPLNTNPIYNRWSKVPQLGGILHAPVWDANVWFLRTE